MNNQLCSPEQGNSTTSREDSALSCDKNDELLAASQVGKIDPTDLITNAESIANRVGKGTCIQNNKPTPVEYVTKRIRLLLQLAQRSETAHGPKEKKKMQLSLIRATVKSYDKIAEANHTNSEEAVREIETQVMLRLQYWAGLGNTFAQMYKKLKLTRTKKPNKSRQNPEILNGKQRDLTNQQKKFEAAQLLYNDVIDLLTMSAMKLPLERPFPAFLRGCLDKSFTHREPSSLLPKNIFQQIFGKFEVKDSSNMANEEVILFTQTMLPRRKKKRHSQQRETRPVDTINPPTASSNNDGPQNDQKKHNSLTSQPLKIVAPGTRKKNSLFASGNANGHRSSYVGSHFNTNLVNTTSLFREVKMPKKKTNVSSTARGPSKHPSSSKTTVNKTKSGPESSKRKLLNCFQTANSTSSAKLQKVSLVGKRAQDMAMDRLNTTKGLGADVSAARRVVAAARTALKRQS